MRFEDDLITYELKDTAGRVSPSVITNKFNIAEFLRQSLL